MSAAADKPEQEPPLTDVERAELRRLLRLIRRGAVATDVDAPPPAKVRPRPEAYADVLRRRRKRGVHG